MRVIYEFNPEPDSDDLIDLKITQIATRMYIALLEIASYLVGVRNGIIDATVEQMEDYITGIVRDSGVHEIEQEYDE